VYSCINNKEIIINKSNYLSYLSDNQIAYSGGEKYNDDVSVSKTITARDKEDYFDITLKIKTKKEVNEYLKNEDVAIVIVMDLSNTMNEGMDGESASYENSKASAASFYAGEFVKNFYSGLDNYPNSVIGAVGFNTNGVKLAEVTHLNDDNEVETFVNTLSNNIERTVKSYTGNSYENRYTNIEAGLKMARTMLDSCSQKYKYIIFLSDGLPTTYTKTNNKNDYTGVAVKTLKDGINKNRVLAYGGNYSDTGAVRAREVAMELKNNGVDIYSIGVGLNTFKGTLNSTLPYGNNNTNLNGEQMLINQLARSVVLGISTVENTFNNITNAKTGISWWNTYREAIYNLDWEITKNYNPLTMIDTPKYELSESPPANQPSLFEQWIKYAIGSGDGYYYDVTDINGLSGAIENIYNDLDETVLRKKTSIWRTVDPLSSVDNTSNELLEYIEFIGFYDSNNILVNELNLTNSNNTSHLDKSELSDGVIYWDLKKSLPTIENDMYIYEIKYKVRLKTDKQGFIKQKEYETNGVTTLTYVVEEDNVESDIKTINFEVPRVFGFLTDLKVKKIVEGISAPLTESNSNFEFIVSFKDLDNNDIQNEFTYDLYNSSNNLIKNGVIKSGDIFTLKDEEYIVIHNLYHDIKWEVKEVLKDGFVSNIESGSNYGITASNIPLNEVIYKNVLYQMKIKKIDSKTQEPLEGVKFSIYKDYDNQVFNNPVTNMNGVLLYNLTTNSEGVIDFGNISFDKDSGSSIYLVEEDSIDKYNKLENYVLINIDKDGITLDNLEYNVRTSNYVYEIEVPNTRGIDLPETGGKKSMFNILGYISILIGCTYYIKVKKG